MLKPSYELNSCGTIYHPTETQWVKNVNLSSSDSAVFLLLFFFLVWSGFGQDMLHWPDIILVSCWAVDCCSCSLGTAAKKKNYHLCPLFAQVCSLGTCAFIVVTNFSKCVFAVNVCVHAYE